MLNAHLTRNTQRALAFYFSNELAQCLKTTIFKSVSLITGFENRIKLPLQKEFLYKSSILGVPRLIAFGEQALADFSH